MSFLEGVALVVLLWILLLLLVPCAIVGLVESWEGGAEQRDAVKGGPEMRGEMVEESDGRGFVLLCMACVSSMTNAIREVRT